MGRRLNWTAIAAFLFLMSVSACTGGGGSSEDTSSQPSNIEAPGVNAEGYGGATRIRINRVSLARVKEASGAARTLVTLFGENFVFGAVVTVNQQRCEIVEVTNANQLTCTVNAEVPQIVEVVVSAPGRETGTLVASGPAYFPPAPEITSISPASGLVSGGALLTVDGRHFELGSTVKIGLTSCLPLTFVSSTRLTCTLPAKSAGSHDVKVLNQDGQSFTLVNAYTAGYAAPTLGTVSPSTGSTLGGTAITITGTAFQVGASVSVGAAQCAGVSVTLPTQITCTTPAGATGSVTVSIQNPDGQSASKANGFTFAAPSTGGTWRALNPVGAPAARMDHAVIWTGSVAVVWGGSNMSVGLKSGSRYDPINDSWIPTNEADAPAFSAGFSAVWLGNRMIIWGGYSGGFSPINTGSRYDPILDSWAATATLNAPQGRRRHVAVAANGRMIVWGGDVGTNQYVNTGGIYNPITDIWESATSTSGAVPSNRGISSAFWTGREMLIWGGWNGTSYFGDGAHYDPATNGWAAISTTNAPVARYNYVSAWTGSEMIIWGGGLASGPGLANNGGRYNPQTKVWTAMPTLGRPVTTITQVGIWADSRLLVWGGNNGNQDAFYMPPPVNAWFPMSSTNEPTERYIDPAQMAWTGSEMIAWGGRSYMGVVLADGGAYKPPADPAANTWAATSTTQAPVGRSQFISVWTGSEMIVWGGWDGTNYLNTGGRYNPISDAWTPTSTNNPVPSARNRLTGVWSGKEMIVWGGGDGNSSLNSGGKYDPVLNQWSATQTINAPMARVDHTAVWADSEMLVWGGYSESLGRVVQGGRYNPVSDSWQLMSTANVPLGKTNPTSVWTGEEMIVWGGVGSGPGGKYRPRTDSWSGLSTTQEPIRTNHHVAVWTGKEMIVWGGWRTVGSGYVNTGGRYNPANDTWAPTETNGAPNARQNHSAIWTGKEMVVWGGLSATGHSNSGGRYDPVADVWATINLTGAPSARYLHQAVWTGREMIVWGGFGSGIFQNTGGRFIP